MKPKLVFLMLWITTATIASPHLIFETKCYLIYASTEQKTPFYILAYENDISVAVIL